MVQVPRRQGLSGPALIRLLVRLTDVDVAQPAQSLADRLSLWLEWTDAIALSGALNARLPEASTPAARDGKEDGEETACAQVRASLTTAISNAAARRRTVAHRHGRADVADEPADYTIYRQRYMTMQHAMETDIGSLRGRLRAALAARAPAMTRLAMVDAAMERALGGRERTLLALVPGLLEKHFERLRMAEEAALAQAQEAGAARKPRRGAWLETFRADMRSVLLAELDIRFQPVDGLLAALRTR
ncbi:hypothetical protein CAL14_02980 [Bordetella genomosp. 9]|uniref:DUF3348 domain-containing protein n=1 Tax=Bordetella genomosp. 9 TaxID=1416803 RepID=UPI000A29314F|nr:DUF3348 domain-containing protein [Bordetella genomosp. 9]ARP89385.1 hypothetical protein CAL14_02980 [Bordetella genomosp. 9]